MKCVVYDSDDDDIFTAMVKVKITKIWWNDKSRTDDPDMLLEAASLPPGQEIFEQLDASDKAQGRTSTWFEWKIPTHGAVCRL